MAWAVRHRSVSPPGSSNRTCRFPAFGFARGKVKNSFPASPLLLLLARLGNQGHVAGTTALPPTADIRAPMSAFPPIWSASPSGAELASSIAECLFLTQTGHRRLDGRSRKLSKHLNKAANGKLCPQRVK